MPTEPAAPGQRRAHRLDQVAHVSPNDLVLIINVNAVVF